MKTSNIVLSMFMLFGVLLVMLGLKMISFGTLFFITVILGIIFWVLIAKSIKNTKKAASPDTKVKESGADTKAEEAKTLQARLEQAKAEEARLEQAKVEEARLEQAKAEETRTEQAKAEQVKAEQVKAEQAKAEQVKAEQAKAEQVKAEQAKAEQARAEQVKAEQVKAEQARAEQARAEQVKAEQARAEQARAEQARAEQARAEQARAEQARAEQARAEQAKAAQARTEHIEQAKAKTVKKGHVEVSKAKTDKVKKKEPRIPAPIDERKTVRQVNPISMEIGEKLIPVRENWFAEYVNKIGVYNKKHKNDGNQIIIENQSIGGEAEIVLKVLQISVINDYLEKYKYLEDNAGVGFKNRLETCVFAEQSAECLTYLKKIQTDKDGNSRPEESQAAQLLDMARAIAGYIASATGSKAAADLAAENIPEFIDLTHIESAKALGDKKTVEKLSNKIENLKRR